MTRTYIHTIIGALLMLLHTLPVQAQFTSSETLKTKIDRFESTLHHDVTAHLTLSSWDCAVPSVGFAHLVPVFKLVSTRNSKAVYFEKEAMFIKVDNSNCVNGKFVTRTSVEIPRDVFLKDSEFVLLLTLSQNNKTFWNTQSSPFTLSDVNPGLRKKIKADFLEVSQVKARIAADELNIAFNYTNTLTGAVTFYTEFYLDGVACGMSKTSLAKAGFNFADSLTTPYTSLFIPAGKHQLTYRIFGETFPKKRRQVASGKITVNQPQLSRLSFQSARADIDVTGMDKVSSLAQVLSKKGGKGLGDAYYEIRNGGQAVFVSPDVSHSGKIPDQKAIIQIYPNRSTKLHFLDKDVFSYDMIEEYDLQLKTGGPHHLNIKKGRILNFDFRYTLTPVDHQNYRLK